MSSPRRSPSDRHRRVPGTRLSCGEKDKGWYTTEPFSDPEVFGLPTASGRSSGTSSTKKCAHAPAGIDAQKVTFKSAWRRPSRYSGTLRKFDWTDGPGEGRTSRGSACATSSPPARPDHDVSATRSPARPARDCTSPAPQGRGAAGRVPVPRGGQRLDDERVRRSGCGGRPPCEPGRGTGTARRKRVVRRRGAVEAMPAEPFLNLLSDGYGREWKMQGGPPPLPRRRRTAMSEPFGPTRPRSVIGSRRSPALARWRCPPGTQSAVSSALGYPSRADATPIVPVAASHRRRR